MPVFYESAPSTDELEAVLLKIITRTMRILTRLGVVIEEPDRTYLAETATDGALRSLQAASCTYRIALGPRAGQKLLSLQSLPSQVTASTQSCVSTRTALASMRQCAGGWARLLKRIFDIDVEHCPNCGGALKIIAAIEDPPVIVSRSDSVNHLPL